MYGDSAYGTGAARAAYAQGGHDTVIKAKPLLPAVPGGFTLDDFAIDEQAGTVTCPGGHTRTMSPKRTVTFGAVCADCPLRARCTTAKDGRSMSIHEHEALLRAARAQARTPEFKQAYPTRSTIERIVGWTATSPGRRIKLRYLGVAGGHRGDGGADRRGLFLFCSHRCGRIRLPRTGIADAGILVGGRGRVGAVTDCAGVGPVVAVAGDHLLAHRRVAALLTGRLAQLAVGDQAGARLGRDVPASSSAEVARRAWSNGSVATRRTLPVTRRLAAGDSHNAASIALALTPPDAGSTSVVNSPARSTESACAPAGSTASMSLMRPSVKVPVLSVISTSMSPRSSMHTNRLTRTLRRASRRDPVARLALTTAGSSCGVMPTAIARANSTESITDRRRNRLVIKIDQHGQGERHPQQQIGEAAQAGLELRLGLPFTQTRGDTAELGIHTGRVHHPDPFAGADDGAHERQIGRISQARIGLDRPWRLLGSRPLAGQDAFVAFQPVDVDQPHVGRHRFAERQPDHIAGHQGVDIDPGELPVAAHHRGVVHPRMQRSRGAFGAVLVDETQADTGGQDDPDDHRLFAVPEEERNHGGGRQQPQHRAAQLAPQHRDRAHPMGANSIGAVAN